MKLAWTSLFRTQSWNKVLVITTLQLPHLWKPSKRYSISCAAISCICITTIDRDCSMGSSVRADKVVLLTQVHSLQQEHQELQSQQDRLSVTAERQQHRYWLTAGSSFQCRDDTNGVHWQLLPAVHPVGVQLMCCDAIGVTPKVGYRLLLTANLWHHCKDVIH